jgi:hypothetical protein
LQELKSINTLLAASARKFLTQYQTVGISEDITLHHPETFILTYFSLICGITEQELRDQGLDKLTRLLVKE